MVDSVDVVEFNPNKSDAETTIQDWMDNNTYTTWHEVEVMYEKTGRVGLAIIYEA